MRVIVCGGRNYGKLHRVMEELVKIGREDPLAVIIHGAARGADTIARFVAEDLGLRTEAHPADWAKHGKRAGPIRNQEMLGLGADLVIAFSGGKGTADMVRRARAAGVEVREVKDEQPQGETSCTERADSTKGKGRKHG